MKDSLDFLETKVFYDIFGAFDKKLRKNVIKRCGIEPLVDLVFGELTLPSDGEQPQDVSMKNEAEDLPMIISPLLNEAVVMDVLTELLTRVVSEGYTTEALSDKIVPSLKRFLRLINRFQTSEQN